MGDSCKRSGVGVSVGAVVVGNRRRGGGGGRRGRSRVNERRRK